MFPTQICVFFPFPPFLDRENWVLSLGTKNGFSRQRKDGILKKANVEIKIDLYSLSKEH